MILYNLTFSLIITQIYRGEKNNKGILSQASKKEHIVDQWFELYTIIPGIDDDETLLFLMLVRRAAIPPNSQRGCERVNLPYNLARNGLSSAMTTEMVQVRLRIKINGPPVSKFNARDARIEWIKKVMNMQKRLAEEDT